MVARLTPGLSLDTVEKAFNFYKFDNITPETVLTDEDKILEEEVFQERQKTARFVIEDLGLSALHPEENPMLWPPPEGKNVHTPSVNCLRCQFEDIMSSDQSLLQDYQMMVNRVQLHTCKLVYCIKKDTNLCRFHFPKVVLGFDPDHDEAGMMVALRRVLEDYEDGAKFVTNVLNLVRNHPRVVVHIPEFLTVWRSNTDQKMIESWDKLQRYHL